MPGNFNLQKQIELLKDTSRQITTLDLLPYNEEQMFNTIGYKYKNRKEYDSIQKALPASERDGWLQGKWNKRIIYLNEKYKREQQSSFSRFSEVLLHQMPYLLFVSLPFFALILKLLYIRRKQFYYTDHGIFTIHFYIFSFILLLFVFLFDYLSDLTGWGLMNFLMAMTILAWPVYLFIAMRRFYRQNGFKTFAKFCLLSILGVFLAAILMLVFFLLSIFQI
ncbi:MAG TPA: hypothetical protein PK951_01365 [Chitinophagaceae bacterium]|nr:hypothetical protein [Chitinophagaceae bacterium]